MAQVHTKSLRKKTTGLRRSARGKKVRDLGGVWSRTIIGTVRRSISKTKGGDAKVSLRSSDVMSLSVGGNAEQTKVLTVLENSANPHFVRRNIMTKGAIVQTEKGYAKVTSSPGQAGVLSGILLPDYEPVTKKAKKAAKQAAAKLSTFKETRAPKVAKTPLKAV